MTYGLFDSQIADLRARIDALSKIAEENGSPVAEAIAGLQSAVEELSAAQEELLQQNEELRSAQEAIEEERQKYQDLFDSTPDAYLTTDLGGIIQTANQTAAVKLGWSAESLAGWPLANLVALEDRMAFRAAKERLVQGHEAQEWTVRIRPPKAAPFDAAIRAMPVRHGRGAATGVRWLLRDVRDQKNRHEAIVQIDHEITVKQAEEALRESEQRFHGMFERHHAVKLLIEPETGAIVDANAAAVRFYGCSREELCSLHIQDINQLPPDEVAIERAKAATEQRSYFVFPHRLANGEMRWVEVYSTPVETRGRVLLYSIIHDITERKRAGQALKESEAKYRNLFENMTEEVHFWKLERDAEGHIKTWRLVDANPPTLKTWGMKTLDEIRGKTTDEIFGPGATDHYLPVVQKIMTEGVPFVFEDYFPNLDRHFRFTSVPLGEHFITTGADITSIRKAHEALRKSEERERQRAGELQAVLDTAPIAIWIAHDPQCRRITGNAAADQLLQTPRSANISASAPSDEAAVSYKVFRAGVELTPEQMPAQVATATGRPVVGDELDLVLADGRTLHLVESAVPLLDAGGRVRGAIIAGEDITERKRAEEQLQAAKAIAESASKAKDQFIAVLSHELRTPLTPALAAVSMMEADMRLPRDTREDLAMVRRNIDLEVRLIADLLDVSRIISGKLYLEKCPMDVIAAIHEAAQIISGDLDAKGQTLTIDTPPAPCLTFGDAARLQQVFWNLLRNASKFTPHRGRNAVRASVVSVDRCPLAANPPVCPVGMGDCPLPQASEGDGQPCECNLIIEVSDNGRGIAPEMLPRLFNAFEQAQEARTFGGLGLGLSICKAVVELHGGTITAHSDGSGKGANFTVRLPIAQCPLSVASGQLPVASEAPALATDNSQPATSVRILLVEDHADTARLMKRLLMLYGHEVIVADSVATGLAAVENAAGKLDLLISDLGLPDGTGHDLMRQLLEQGKAIPGIALSGYGAPADIEKSKATGFAEHLLKPTSPDLVAAAIARTMASRNLAEFGGG